MDRLRRLGPGAGVGALALAMIVMLSACSGGGDSSESLDAPVADRDAGAAKNIAPPAEQGTTDGQEAGSAPSTDVSVSQRSIVYTGSMTIRVTDVDTAARHATSIAIEAGGFIGGDQRTSDERSSEAILTLRVPADKFNEVVEQIADLGDQQRRDIHTEDVTEEVLDLDARIETQRARVESGRRLLAQAETLQELIMLEGELARREADLASLEAKKRRLDDLTALSTITVKLLGPAADGSKEDLGTGFMAGLKAGWKALVNIAKLVLTLLGALLPFILAFGVPGFGIWLIHRARRNRRPSAPVTPASAPAEAGGQVPPGTRGPVSAAASTPGSGRLPAPAPGPSPASAPAAGPVPTARPPESGPAPEPTTTGRPAESSGQGSDE